MVFALLDGEQLICEWASVLPGRMVRLVKLPDGTHQSQRWWCGRHVTEYDMRVESAQTIAEYVAYAASQKREAARPKQALARQAGLWT
jgi:hypothetical protein